MRRIEYVKRIIGCVLLITVLCVTTTCYAFTYRGKLSSLRKEYQEKINYYRKVATKEQDLIASRKLSNGAIPFYGIQYDKAKVNPYFSDTAARALLMDISGEDYSDIVKEYILWHFAHLNSSEEDYNGIAGTIYDYDIELEDGIVIGETAKEKYDSIDSYTGLFLVLLGEYYTVTEDKELILDYSEQIQQVIDAMLSCLADNGLTYAKPDYRLNYLMDNCEVNYALRNTLILFEEVYLDEYPEESEEYGFYIDRYERIEEILLNNAAGIEEYMWNSSEKRYEKAVSTSGRPASFKGWEVFYSEVVCQVFPVMYDIEPAGTKRSASIYGKVCKAFDWENLEHYYSGEASFYWPLLAYAAAKMGDVKRVETYIDNYTELMTETNYKYPWYTAESGWVVMACEEMIDYYENKINRLGKIFK